MSNPRDSIVAGIEALPVNDDWGVAATALLLQAAHGSGASDLHVLCQRDAVVVSLRRDSRLEEVVRIPNQRRDLLLARFKVMARLPAFVRQEPQDGRLEWTPPGADRAQLLRVSFLPTIHGESLVVRFPEGATAPPALEGLGMRPDMLERLKLMMAANEGVVIATGPSGSGKTTTLYALIRWLHGNRSEALHVVTIEDPVERDLGFASQVQVDEAKGLTFDKGLRAALRQDPNILLIGEIRDLETARIAMQAGMTGHLVLTSLHAGRAGRVPSRLVSLGVERYAVASALAGAVAQRLVTTGEGRRGLFELGVMTEAARDMVLAGAGPDQVAAELLRLCPGTIGSEARRLIESGAIQSDAARHLLAEEDAT